MMYPNIHYFRILLPLVALLLVTVLVFTKNKLYFSNRFQNVTDIRNSILRDNRSTILESARNPCFTAGFYVSRNGLGNILFYYATVMLFAWLTGRKPILLNSPKQRTKVEIAFDIDIARLDHQKGCSVKYFEHRSTHTYYNAYKAYDELINVDTNVSIRLIGSCCRWKFTQPIEDQLRRKLRFRREIKQFADTFLSSNIPRGWNVSTFARVGVHVRRGEFLRGWAVKKGFTVASLGYLKHAMTYFVERHPMVQFIVASNDIRWCRQNIKPSWFNQQRVNITFSVKHFAAQDLALLSSCNHTVITTETYSWWAAFLANGTTVYYKHYPRYGSWLWKHYFRPAEYFYPTWIGMD